jgi:alginate O-acetyltransferase complex protein AlgI
MVFSSAIFLVYFLPIFLLCYIVSPKFLKNYVILFFSIIFYAWGAPKFIFVLLPLTAIDFFIVKKMARVDDLKLKKRFLAASIFINLGLLAYFKYANFFVENVNAILIHSGHAPVEWVKVALPIGISFFCFETLTYSIDVYRGTIKPLDRLTDYYVYILLFPKLICGPIVRFHLIGDQIRERFETMDDRLKGFFRFIIGLSKKVLIADVLGRIVEDTLKDGMDIQDSSKAWIVLLAYTFQIYFDFSGYTDMALGIGRMIGFKLPENFDNPYTSSSITEFWKRWHMTLGAWMKEYIYIPLGGNKVTIRRGYINLCIVFLISGLWHGGSWNYVIWGAYHGIFLVLERAFLLKIYHKIGKFLSMMITFILVMLGWVLFKIEDLAKAKFYYSKLFAFDFQRLPFSDNREFYFTLLMAAFFAFFIVLPFGKRIQQKVYYDEPSLSHYSIATFTSISLFILCLAYVTASGFTTFIYYRF